MHTTTGPGGSVNDGDSTIYEDAAGNQVYPGNYYHSSASDISAAVAPGARGIGKAGTDLASGAAAASGCAWAAAAAAAVICMCLGSQY